MTKTFRPVLRPAVAPPPADELALAPAADPDAEAAAELAAGAALLEELEAVELQAASATVAATGNASASFFARLRVIYLYPFNVGAGSDTFSCAGSRVRVSRTTGATAAVGGAGGRRRGGR